MSVSGSDPHLSAKRPPSASLPRGLGALNHVVVGQMLPSASIRKRFRPRRGVSVPPTAWIERIVAAPGAAFDELPRTAAAGRRVDIQTAGFMRAAMSSKLTPSVAEGRVPRLGNRGRRVARRRGPRPAPPCHGRRARCQEQPNEHSDDAGRAAVVITKAGSLPEIYRCQAVIRSRSAFVSSCGVPSARAFSSLLAPGRSYDSNRSSSCSRLVTLAPSASSLALRILARTCRRFQQ